MILYFSMKLGVECNNSLKNRKRSKQSGLHINAGKTKLMQIVVFEDEEVNTIQAEGGEIESVEEFCCTLVVWY